MVKMCSIKHTKVIIMSKFWAEREHSEYLGVDGRIKLNYKRI
jgi:hypothetical protein